MVFTLIIGVWFVVAGVVRFIVALVTPEGRGGNIFTAILDVIAGIVILSWPDLGLATLAVIIGIVLIVRGALFIFAGWQLRKLEGDLAGSIAMARRPAETISVLTYRTGVQDANLAGNVHGGWVMKLCDDVAVIAATRLAGGRVVTAAVDAMQFRAPVKVGDVITLRATVNATWRTSMEVGVRVDAEHVPTGELTHTCTAYLTMVALGEDEKPVPLPALEPETPEDERRRRDAEHRREIRLAAPGELRRVTD